MTDEEKAQKVEHWLRDHQGVWAYSAAKAILSDTSEFMEVLSDVGAVETWSSTYLDGRPPAPVYRVIQPEPPHVHEPYVLMAWSTADYLRLACKTCRETRYVPTTLPIEWPES